MYREELFNNGTRKWYYIGRDPNKKENVIDTNEYVVIDGDKAMMTDPGGLEIFPPVFSQVSQITNLENIEFIFASHQDPDIVSSLSLWWDIMPNAEVFVPWVWETFIPHFGGSRNLTPIPDEGMTFTLGNSHDLKLIPAHYCHSSGNFSLYDPQAKILFSGDIGAALLPPGTTEIFVKDFESHIAYIEAFHVRWMPSNEAKNLWIKDVRELEVDMLCPQHGSIYKGEDVNRFLDWFEKLQVGSANQRGNA